MSRKTPYHSWWGRCRKLIRLYCTPRFLEKIAPHGEFSVIFLFIFFSHTTNENWKPTIQRNGIYIYIRGVTVHKIHGSVRYDTVVSRFGMFSIRGAGQLVTSQCWKYFCFKPWRQANGYQTSTRLHQGLHTCKLCARFMPVNILIAVNSL